MLGGSDGSGESGLVVAEVVIGVPAAAPAAPAATAADSLLAAPQPPAATGLRGEGLPPKIFSPARPGPRPRLRLRCSVAPHLNGQPHGAQLRHKRGVALGEGVHLFAQLLQLLQRVHAHLLVLVVLEFFAELLKVLQMEGKGWGRECLRVALCTPEPPASQVDAPPPHSRLAVSAAAAAGRRGSPSAAQSRPAREMPCLRARWAGKQVHLAAKNRPATAIQYLQRRLYLVACSLELLRSRPHPHHPVLLAPLHATRTNALDQVDGSGRPWSIASLRTPSHAIEIQSPGPPSALAWSVAAFTGPCRPPCPRTRATGSRPSRARLRPNRQT